MNYKDKKNNNIENDDMNIKSHLNASLDLSGISVTEDLINRTLEAVKKNSSEQKTAGYRTAAQKTSVRPGTAGTKGNLEAGHRKIILWNRYTRTFAGVAAAAIVVIAGYGLMSSGLFSGRMKDNMNSGTAMMAENNSAPEEAAGNSTLEAAEQEVRDDVSITSEEIDTSSSPAADDTDSGNKSTIQFDSVQYSIKADMEKEASGSDTDSGDDDEIYGASPAGSAGGGADGYAGGRNAASPEASSGEADRKGTEAQSVLSFRDIFPADPAKAQLITITDEVSRTFIKLATRSEIDDFYKLMDQQQFVYAKEADINFDYSIVMTADPENINYTMLIGKHIAVIDTLAETTGQSLYDPVDEVGLKQSIKEFFEVYSQ